MMISNQRMKLSMPTTVASDDDDDAAHVAKVEIASRIFRNYYCGYHGKRNFTFWNFAKKGLEPVLF